MPDSFANGAAAADMARIFEPLAGRTSATAGLQGDNSTVGRTGLKRRSITFVAPALVIIATIGLATAFVTSKGVKERAPAANDRSQITPSQNTTPPQPKSADSSTPPHQAQAIMVPETGSLQDGQTGELQTSSATSPASITTPSERAKTTPRPDATGKSRADAAPSPPRAGGAVQKFQDRREGFANLPRCTPGSTEDRCIYQDVLNADSRLRTAFDNAQRNGVSNAQLATIRARWNTARRDADDDPDGTIWRYNQLTATLDRMARSDTE